jgi:hypothetical protein
MWVLMPVITLGATLYHLSSNMGWHNADRTDMHAVAMNGWHVWLTSDGESHGIQVMGEMADGILNDHWWWPWLLMWTTTREWPYLIPWWTLRGIEAAHLQIDAQVDDNMLLWLQLVLSIHGASCEWSETGNHYEITCSTQNQLVIL